MNKFWQQAVQNPKSTISGVLSFVAITSTALIPFTHAPKALVVLAIASGLAKAYVLALSTDAGTVPAITPEGEIKPVASHEQVDNPANVPVKP